jgi:hypothetical protein
MPTPTEILDFEEAWTGRRDESAKEEAIRATLGIPPATFYMRLSRVIDTPEALEARPMLVKRLLRMRDERERIRAARVRRA